MTINELYEKRLGKNVNREDPWPDIMPRAEDLRRYGSMVKTVVEFGLRSGNSTVCFLAGGADVTSYDMEIDKFVCPLDAALRFRAIKADTGSLESIPECDLLFIDTRHTREQVAKELRMAKFVKRFILFHDVIVSGWNGDDGEPGIDYAILDFLREHDHEWYVKEILLDRYGLLVLERK